jgi:hypothetical protein
LRPHATAQAADERKRIKQASPPCWRCAAREVNHV